VKRINAKISRMVATTVLGTARAFERDLRDFINAEHRVTGRLVESIETTLNADGPGTADVGSDLPYAKFFERQTGAALEFTEGWAKRGGKAAEAAAKKAAL
jgi:hypothetical protein